MSNKDYYERWLKLKKEFQAALAEDGRIQELAIAEVGLKPQATAVEIVARVYGKYCHLYNSFCDCFDQMEQVQRRPYIKTIIEALTCRIIELKNTLEEVEVFEYTYPDNALQQMLIKPQDIEILCPFFYPFEIRQAEQQYIMDQIFAGNRIGDPPPTQEEIERKEEELREQQEQEEKEADMKKTLAGDLYESSEGSKELSPSEIEANRLREEYEGHIFNIQRMERSRCVTRARAQQKNKDENLYLELAGLKKPKAREDLRIKAAEMMQTLLRMYMKLKRDHLREELLRKKLDMVITPYKQLSAKEQLEKVREARRNFRRAYYENWLAASLKEKARVLRLKEGDVMDDISDEIRQWFTEWFDRVCVFDDFPYPEEGGSILIVRGETFSIEEYVEWKELEEKRLKAQGAAPKTKEQIKAEKKAALEEKRRIAQELREKEKKRLIDYKKSRMNPDNDPGVYLQAAKNLENLRFAWASYEGQWKDIDEPDAALDAIRGHLKQLITENAYRDILIELRPLVDETMRLELDILKKAMKESYGRLGGQIPMTQKRKKPKKVRPPRPEKITAETMFQVLADNGIVRQYPRVTLDDYWGDRNYAAADCRAILWTPSFPQPCVGDVKEQVRIRCLLTIGATCPSISRCQLIVGPKNSGKKTLIYAVATETNALLIDLSPMNVYNKLLGPKNTKMLWTYVNKISRMMQPTIIFVDNADKLFYKKVPKEDKMFDPTRLSKDFFKQIIKPIGINDKILVLGTASEPWLAKTPKMSKVFPNVIMLPATDYGSLSYILKRLLMEYHNIDREFNVHSLAQTLKGYDIYTIKTVITKMLSGKRRAELKFKPLEPMEILQAVLLNKDAVYTGATELEMFQTWYTNYSPWGQKCVDYMLMIDSQYQYKLKQDKKKKGK